MMKNQQQLIMASGVKMKTSYHPKTQMDKTVFKPASSNEEELTAVDYGEWSEDENIIPSKNTEVEDEKESSLGSQYIFTYRKINPAGTSDKFKNRLLQDILVPEDEAAFIMTDVEYDEQEEDNQQVKSEMRIFLDKVA
jgi:hypothetical protein